MFLFNGGDCSQSFITDGADLAEFSCTDFNGGPGSQIGDRYYIYTTNEKGDKYYQDDYVTVGDSFVHQLPDQSAIHGGPQATMSIYTDETKTTLLQQVVFNQYCQNGLELGDKFGSAQLIEWATEDQVSQSIVTNYTYQFDISVPVSNVIFEGEAITVETLTIASNQDPFFWDLSPLVAGQVLVPGTSLQVPPLSVTVDFTQIITYDFVIYLNGQTVEGRVCDGTGVSSFTVGAGGGDGGGEVGKDDKDDPKDDKKPKDDKDDPKIGNDGKDDKKPNN